MPLDEPVLPFINKDPDVLRQTLSEFFATLVVELNTAVPTGTIFAFAGVNIPDGWLICDGASYDQEAYKALAKALGQYDGSGGTFQVPDAEEKVLFGASATYPLGTEVGNFSPGSGTGGLAVYCIIKT